ncbi:MAG: SCP2 sterol-binding domain-containing protein [Solirubrobacteraceae bacterium]
MSWSDRKTQIYADLVARATDEQLARLMRGPLRRPLLRQIFLTMSRRVDPRRAAGVRAVLEFRISGAGTSDRYQVAVASARARVRRDGVLVPDVAITIEPVAFLRLTAGSTGWLDLWLRGRLRIDGSKLLAVRFPGIFRIPRAAEPRAAEPRTDPRP